MYSVREVGVAWIRAEVLERKHRNGLSFVRRPKPVAAN